jgi:hypothetical protein
LEVNLKIIHQDCDQSLAKSKSLPINSYIVKYVLDDEQKYDIVQCGSTVEVFDYYYDKYKNVLSIDWTEGTINPKSYGYTKPEKKKKS